MNGPEKHEEYLMKALVSFCVCHQKAKVRKKRSKMGNLFGSGSGKKIFSEKAQCLLPSPTTIVSGTPPGACSLPLVSCSPPHHYYAQRLSS